MKNFNKCVYINGYYLSGEIRCLFCGIGTWLEDLRSSTPESICNPARNSPDFDTTSDEDEETTIPEITHTVVLKCIGAHKEREYQEMSSRKLKEN